MEDAFIPFDIVIVPPPAIAERAIRMSRTLAQRGGLFELGPEGPFPHLSLYMAEFPLKNMAEVQRRLSRFISSLGPFRIEALRYRHNEGYVDVLYKRSKDLVRLQSEIIALLNPLREGRSRLKDEAKKARWNTTQRRNHRLYGYEWVGSTFFPHLTFTKLKEHNPSVILGMEDVDFSFKVNQLGLYELGDYGTCIKQMRQFNFLE